MSTGISIEQYHELQAANMTEAQLQAVIVAAAIRRGYLIYHTHDSRRSQPGYPDLHLIHAEKGISLFRELKRKTGTLSKDQRTWLSALTAAGQDAAVWRPIDWFNGRVDAELDGKAAS